MTKVLVTLPVHNEAELLYESTHRLAEGLDGASLRYELSIAEDGSTDDTLSVIARLKAEFPNLVVRTSRKRLGRGLALRKLWSQVDADIYAFVDADLASGPEAVLRVVKEAENGADVVTGSRYCPGSVVKRPALRHVISLAYNRIVRLAFHESISDHQCGLKAFTHDAFSKLLSVCREETWAWDTEALVLATLTGLRVVEVPVEWTEYRSVRTPILRLFSDISMHGESLIHLKQRVMSQHLGLPYQGSASSHHTRAESVGAQGQKSALLR